MENTLNSERFYFFSQDTGEDVLRNHALASAVRVVWQSRLATVFPNREFRCFVSNEYVIYPDDNDKTVIGLEGVETVLRLWALPADSPSFDEAYKVDQLAPARVLWDECDKDHLVPLENVFQIIQAAEHPARTKSLQERWHAI